MARLETLIFIIFPFYIIENAQLSYISPIVAQNLNPSIISFLSTISTNLQDVSTLNNHPLVETFTTQFLNVIQINPAWGMVFNTADLPDIEAANTMQKMILPHLKRHGCPQADLIARSNFEGSLATYDVIDTYQSQTAFGRTFAKYLLNRGYLRQENVSQHAKTLAEDIGRAKHTLNPVDKYGNVQVVINAIETFINRLGMKFNDVAKDINEKYFQECACIKKGICN